MTSPQIVLTGASGFIGSKVLRRVLDQNPASGVRAVVRGRPPEGFDQARLHWFQGDLTRPGTLEGLCEGADVVLHLASRIAGTEPECAAVNADGTAALVEEARRGGVRRIVQLSTAAVYGHGPHRGITVDEVPPAPVSPASRTRLRAERVVTEAGGTVLRPGLVTGHGDRWVVPALADLVERVPARWNGGKGLTSMVDADDLARLIARMATLRDEPPAGVHHASHPVPVRNRDLMAELDRLGILPLATADWTWQQCLDHLRRSPGRVGERQFALLCGDNWQRSDTIWRLAGLDAGPGPLERLTSAAPWYRAYLAGRNG
ncbi:NAD(P)-dependent oxidoreductase [Streptomyces sp. AM 2-1-1]|uniref:NAD-dependent epimerase/dehydratase family protein n=1 Tax=Streptomyces sp. AM 2-1-1 TaxID=3028709 RepID=UPI0023BA38AA|nr:NAD(P)-dependent oxidoreductase [Streptomyces sp. AM 2-1-1]WEH39241.1 NAD(P)-dependent oxidoreductase [Streptomyces sp. AM 2-1-1]